MNALADKNSTAFFTYIALSRWMGFYIELVVLLFLFATLLGAYFSRSTHSGALLALAVTSALSLIDTLQYAMTVAIDIATAMTSVQRMQEYNRLPSERPARLPSDNVLPLPWPSTGQLHFDNAVLRYRDDHDPVLKGVSFRVEAGMKVGILGRTGAGKSSLLQALFRLTECDSSGSIVIDGVSTSEVGLRTLRESISLVP